MLLIFFEKNNTGKCERRCFTCEHEEQGDCEKRGSGYGIDLNRRDAMVKREGMGSQEEKTMPGLQEEGHVLWEHDKEYHGGEGKTEYRMRMGRVFGRDNRRRVINEAVRIDIEMNDGIMMNRKGECRSFVLPRRFHKGAERTYFCILKIYKLSFWCKRLVHSQAGGRL